MSNIKGFAIPSGMAVEEQKFKNNTKVKYFPNGTINITCFNYPAYIDDGYELMNKDNFEMPLAVPWSGNDTHKIETTIGNTVNILNKLKRDRSNIIRDDSLKKTKEKIFDIAFANAEHFTHFVTFTLNKEKINRYDKNEVLEKFTTWLKHSVQRKNAYYVIVPEFHKDGAIHFHGLIGGNFDFVSSGTYNIPGKPKPIKAATVHKYGYDIDSPQCQEVFNLQNFPYGYSTAIKLYSDKLYICRYITKYIIKGATRVFGKFYFAGGKGLIRELPTEYLFTDFETNEGILYNVPNTQYKVKYITIGEL